MNVIEFFQLFGALFVATVIFGGVLRLVYRSRQRASESSDERANAADDRRG